MTEKYYIDLFEKFLDNRASDEEICLLRSIIRSDRNIQRLFEEKLVASNPAMDENAKQRIFGNIRKEIRTNKKAISVPQTWKKVSQWAAILLLPVLSAFSVYYFTQKSAHAQQPTIITAQNGEKAEVILPDGSKVWINSGSTLTYQHDFNRKSRPVYLEGEAYFEVAKDKERPFVVKTQSMDVQAIGTTFNVRSYKSEQQVSAILLSGKVKVSALGKETLLNVNQRATFDKYSKVLSTDNVEANNFVEWKKGNIYFNNQTFNDIAQTLSRIYNVDIQFASEELRPMRFSGTLGSSGIKNALDILSLTSPMYYDVKDTTIILHYKENR